MEIFKRTETLRDFLDQRRKRGPIAFVPTMGALHPGHISLIEKARASGGTVVCSIFVNPTQFTDPKDLEKYPRPLEHDVAMLTEAGCDAVFMPAVQEMYPGWPLPEDWFIDLGPAEFRLEGAFRKGHYQGVTQIVKKLFDAVQPDIAFFGQKDYQQVLMIRNMVESLGLPVEIISCPIVREPDGLAMSSRNIHLNPANRKASLVLHRALAHIAEHLHQQPISTLLQEAKAMVHNESGVQLEYLAVTDPVTLEEIEKRDDQDAVALIAARVGGTRLIDNVLLPGKAKPVNS